MKYFLGIFALTCVVIVSILGLRGTKFTQPPLYIFPDMDWQQKYRPQGENHFFNDARDDRPIVTGTIPRGYAWEMKKIFSEDYVYEPALNPSLYTGKDEKGEWIKEFPLEVNHDLMALGQKQFTCFCKVCHGASGDGNGITKEYGMIATASYHSDRLREMAIGEIFNTVTNGKGQMNSYADKLSPYERWAVIAYLRALQKSQDASVNDVPQAYRAELGL